MACLHAADQKKVDLQDVGGSIFGFLCGEGRKEGRQIVGPGARPTSRTLGRGDFSLNS